MKPHPQVARALLVAWLVLDLGLLLWLGRERLADDARIRSEDGAARQRPAVWADDADLARAMGEMEVALDKLKTDDPTRRIVLLVPRGANTLVSIARHVLFPATVVVWNYERESYRDLPYVMTKMGAHAVLVFHPPFAWQVAFDTDYATEDRQ